MIRTQPIPEDIGDFLSYDPETGIIRWIARPTSPGTWRTRVVVGTIAGGKHHGGGRFVKFRGRNYQEHRVAWFLMTGEQPPNFIDHRDLNRSNNRWANLRAATMSQNAANRPRVAGRTVAKGVWPLASGRFYAHIKQGGVYRYLGSFDTEAEAAAAYHAAAVERFGEFARAA